MILLELVAFLIGASYALPVSDRIVGGNDTTIDKYPSIVLIERLSIFGVWGGTCGASIITPRWLVSAAHCFSETDFTSTNRRIRAGSTSRGSGGTLVNIESRINHPGYVGANPDGSYSSIDHDITVVYLSEELVYSNYIQPCGIIAQGSRMPPDNAAVVQVGWGRLVYEGEIPDTLQEVQTYIINQQECWRRYDSYNWPTFNTTITSNMICNAELDVGGVGPCSGDSGGPMFFHGVNVAVGSWGYACADPYFPAVSARISPYTDWILSNVE